jgi:hypothetical protein
MALSSFEFVLKGHFDLPIYIDLAATFLFDLTGALAALKRATTGSDCWRSRLRPASAAACCATAFSFRKVRRW